VPRVVETAQNFMRGFLGAQASVLGSVITVNSTGSTDAVFNSLGPSDLCPAFKDGNGGSNRTSPSSSLSVYVTNEYSNNMEFHLPPSHPHPPHALHLRQPKPHHLRYIYLPLPLRFRVPNHRRSLPLVQHLHRS
jgi:hypothetical protein